jgi:hypothetical protein
VIRPRQVVVLRDLSRLAGLFQIHRITSV